MVRAELIYNPYLLETEVLFNGQHPRINSLVEKYQGEKLQTWINKIPSIFYDEMNGYDFELEFSGTQMDFEELKQSFIQAGAGKDRVKLFHKGELDGRKVKAMAIEDLLKWMKDNPNRRFDYPSFLENYRDLFEGAYPYIVIGGSIGDEQLFDEIDLSIDNVVSADELRKTDLHSTPIVFYLDRKTVGSLQHNLVQVLKRPDVIQDQLFFVISPVLGEKVIRVIMDLGVSKPQVVQTLNDDLIRRYLEIFPVSDYIYEAVKVFRQWSDALETVINEDNQRNEIVNKELHEKIEEQDDILKRLKAAYDRFLNKDNLEMPAELTNAKARLIVGVNRWKNKKTRIRKTEEAMTLANEFDSQISRMFDQFQQEVNLSYLKFCAALFTEYNGWYMDANYKEEFLDDDIREKQLTKYTVPEIASELMSIKDENYVEAKTKEVFFEKFFKTSHDDDLMELVPEVIYYCEKWRAHAVKAVDPVAAKTIQEAFSSLCEYSDRLSEVYMNRIERLIQKATEEKERLSSRLSEDERLLQADKDWHTAFCDRLHDIERS